MVFRLCRLPPRPLRADVTDALALAIAGLSQEGRGARAVLAAHDSYTLFDRLGDLVRTGPTLTNVNDVRAVLVV